MITKNNVSGRRNIKIKMKLLVYVANVITRDKGGTLI